MGIMDSISDGWNAATSAASDTFNRAAQTATDLGQAAADGARDLGQAGLDLGRQGVDAVRNFDVREAAATVRHGISDATEAAREGITTGVNWTSQRVGDGANWARENVPGGDNVVSNAARSAITQVEQNTRFTVGVTGGILREATSTVGAVGQLGTTALEMQVSPEARAEYGGQMLDGITHAATATADYVGGAIQDPSRVGRDLQGAYDGAADFVGGTVERYGTALREGRAEEIGLDVGTVATYVVPIGGGPARGLATAAVREGGEALVRGAATTATREGAEALTGAAVRTVTRDAATGVAAAAEQRGARLLDQIATNGGTAPLEQGAGRVADIAAASRQSGSEIAVYRNANGQRMITQGSEGAVSVPAGSRIVAHTQPGVGGASLTPSVADLDGLAALGQRSSAVIDQGGGIARFSADDARLATGNRASAGDLVTFNAPADVAKVVTTPGGGRITYGALDDLGRPTGVTARITPDMIGTGTKADSSILPPGWSGNGVLHNESRGHLLGRQLGGSGDLPENLVTLQQNPANSPVMSGFETRVRSVVEDTGRPVDYSAIPDYDGSNLVPRGVTLTGHGANGFELGVTILNPPGM